MQNFGYNIVASTGRGGTKLSAFDDALYNSNVGNFNLVKVSSIIPPNSKKLDSLPSELPEGSIIHCAYSVEISNEINRWIVSNIGIAIPDNFKQSGVIMESSNSNIDNDAELENEKNKVIVSLKESMLRRGIEKYKVEMLYKDIKIKSNIYHCVFAGCFIFEI